MKKYIQRILLWLFSLAHKKRMKIQAKQSKAFMLEVINLPRRQRKMVIKKKLWQFRKKMDKPDGIAMGYWCDCVDRAGEAIDLIRATNKNPNECMADIEFHESDAFTVKQNQLTTK